MPKGVHNTKAPTLLASNRARITRHILFFVVELMHGDGSPRPDKKAGLAQWYLHLTFEPGKPVTSPFASHNRC